MHVQYMHARVTGILAPSHPCIHVCQPRIPRLHVGWLALWPFWRPGGQISDLPVPFFFFFFLLLLLLFCFLIFFFGNSPASQQQVADGDRPRQHSGSNRHRHRHRRPFARPASLPRRATRCMASQSQAGRQAVMWPTCMRQPTARPVEPLIGPLLPLLILFSQHL